MTFKDLKKIIADRIEKSVLESTDTAEGSRYWRGKEIIPLDKWLKITKANTISSRDDYNVKEGLRYFPDDYFELMFPLGVEEDLEEEANNWYLDYIELMDYRRNAAYGRTKYFQSTFIVY